MRAGFSVAFSEHVVSVLFNEPKLLKFVDPLRRAQHPHVSVLFNEPKLLKWSDRALQRLKPVHRFSALQRAEIAEIGNASLIPCSSGACFSALQRAEIAEILIGHILPVGAIQFQCSSTSRNC